MLDARHYRVEETLRNGLLLVVRAARPDDEAGVVEAFAKLAPESIYLRFFAPKKAFTESELSRFRSIDFDTRVTLFGTVQENGREVIVASGTYVRLDNDGAEIAFIVEEDYQRLGISRRLIGHLGRIAIDAGLRRFVAEVLPQNTAMLGVFGHCNWPMTSHQKDGTVHVILDLTSSIPGSPS